MFFFLHWRVPGCEDRRNSVTATCNSIVTFRKTRSSSASRYAPQFTTSGIVMTSPEITTPLKPRSSPTHAAPLKNRMAVMCRVHRLHKSKVNRPIERKAVSIVSHFSHCKCYPQARAPHAKKIMNVFFSKCSYEFQVAGNCDRIQYYTTKRMRATLTVRRRERRTERGSIWNIRAVRNESGEETYRLGMHYTVPYNAQIEYEGYVTTDGGG